MKVGVVEDESGLELQVKVGFGGVDEEKRCICHVHTYIQIEKRNDELKTNIKYILNQLLVKNKH